MALQHKARPIFGCAHEYTHLGNVMQKSRKEAKSLLSGGAALGGGRKRWLKNRERKKIRLH